MAEVDPIAFGRRVKELREAIPISTPKLAKITGISQQNLNSIEKGRVRRTGRIVELARALSTTPEYLQFEEGPKYVFPKNPQQEISSLTQLLKPNQASIVIQFLKELTDDRADTA